MSVKGLYGFDREVAEKRLLKYDEEEEAEARKWIEEICGVELKGDFIDSLRNGVVLCALVSIIAPYSIHSFDYKPKHHLEELSNIQKYVRACRKIGVPASDLLATTDLSPSKSDPLVVLHNLYALGRQAQAIGFVGPVLGKVYTVTRQQQLQREKDKLAEKRRDSERNFVYEKELKSRRVFLQQKKERHHSLQVVQTRNRRISRRNSRSRRNRNHLKREESVYPDEAEDERSPSPVRYGVDIDIVAQQLPIDHNLEEEVMDWIEDMSGFEVDSPFLSLKSGVILCEVINVIRPGSVKRINRVADHQRKRRHMLLEKENLHNFLTACSTLNLPSSFHVDDLYAKKDMKAVLNTIYSLAKFYSKESPEFAPSLRSTSRSILKRAPSFVITDDGELLPSLPLPVPEVEVASLSKTSSDQPAVSRDQLMAISLNIPSRTTSSSGYGKRKKEKERSASEVIGSSLLESLRPLMPRVRGRTRASSLESTSRHSPQKTETENGKSVPSLLAPPSPHYSRSPLSPRSIRVMAKRVKQSTLRVQASRRKGRWGSGGGDDVERWGSFEGVRKRSFSSVDSFGSNHNVKPSRRDTGTLRAPLRAPSLEEIFAPSATSPTTSPSASPVAKPKTNIPPLLKFHSSPSLSIPSRTNGHSSSSSSSLLPPLSLEPLSMTPRTTRIGKQPSPSLSTFSWTQFGVISTVSPSLWFRFLGFLCISVLVSVCVPSVFVGGNMVAFLCCFSVGLCVELVRSFLGFNQNPVLHFLIGLFLYLLSLSLFLFYSLSQPPPSCPSTPVSALNTALLPSPNCTSTPLVTSFPSSSHPASTSAYPSSSVSSPASIFGREKISEFPFIYCVFSEDLVIFADAFTGPNRVVMSVLLGAQALHTISVITMTSSLLNLYQSVVTPLTVSPSTLFLFLCVAVGQVEVGDVLGEVGLSWSSSMISSLPLPLSDSLSALSSLPHSLPTPLLQAVMLVVGGGALVAISLRSGGPRRLVYREA